MKGTQYKYLIPGIPALVFTVILIWVIPQLRNHYRLLVLETVSEEPGKYYYYRDLDGDGSSEQIANYSNNAGNLAIYISDARTNRTINQFNLPGELTELGPAYYFQDIDTNGIEDIFICSENNDSLFLSIIDDPYGHPTRSRLYFLDRIRQYSQDADYLYIPGGLSDLNGDGYQEYIFAINGGHALQPRRVYAIDYHNDTVLRSPISGASIVSLILFDLDGDGNDEILLNTTAPENFKIPFPYSDSITYLMILDHTLQFFTPPEGMSGAPSGFSIEPFFYGDNRYLLTLSNFIEADGMYNSTLTIYDNRLNAVKSRYFRGYRRDLCNLWRKEGQWQLDDIRLVRNNLIYSFDMNLRITDSVQNSLGFQFWNESHFDLDENGQKEYVLIRSDQLYIFSPDLKQSASVRFHKEERVPRQLISLIRFPDSQPILFAQVGTEALRLRYRRNPWHQFRLVIYPGMAILIYLFFMALLLLLESLISRRYERDRLISRLQLMSIKNQLDPHFTYNALNAVGSLIYKEEKDLAYRYLKGLTDLLRMVSGDTPTVTWTLGDEFHFVLKYLEIEKLRFREKFNYGVSVEREEMKDLQVPKMCILTFVENAIKHGLRHKEGSWLLEILAKTSGNGISISVRDNGIGRAAALKYREESSGQGIEMMEQYFRQYSEATGIHAHFGISDLFDKEKRASGTLVEITIE